MKFEFVIKVFHYFTWRPWTPKPPKRHEARRIVFVLPCTPDPVNPFSQEITHMDLKVGQSKTLQLVGKTAAGAPARIDTQDAAPEYTSSDPAVASVAVGPDGLSVTVTAVAPGTADIGARADADLDAGETRFLDAAPVTVVVTAVEEEAATIELVEI